MTGFQTCALPISAFDKVKVLKVEFEEAFKKCIEEKDAELLKVTFEKALDSAINQYLKIPLNSPLCGRGYYPPRQIGRASCRESV